MSFVPPYSASVVGVVPVLSSPQLKNKCMVFHGTVASSDSSMPIMISYWPGSEPRAAILDDTVFISGSIWFTASNGTVTAISDVSYVNVLVDAKHASLLEPTSDLTVIFFLTGMVLSDIPSKREFILETGSWSTEVCACYEFTFPCFSYPGTCSPLQLWSGVRSANSLRQNDGRIHRHPLWVVLRIFAAALMAAKVEPLHLSSRS